MRARVFQSARMRLELQLVHEDNRNSPNANQDHRRHVRPAYIIQYIRPTGRHRTCAIAP